jgi:uncharacterized MAPEG superfamily protein
VLLMSIEAWSLLGGIVLALVHLTATSFALKAQVGNRYTVGARDEGLKPEGLAGRLNRAQQNFNETFSAFAAAVLLNLVLQTNGNLSSMGAPLYVGGRIAICRSTQQAYRGCEPSPGIPQRSA